jgi:hypothetical protein
MRRHPERIYNELGVHLHVFVMLLIELRGLGYSDSRYVSLEEQLAIFLYICRTGLGCRHVGEHFQRTNETITKLVNLLPTMHAGSITMYSHGKNVVPNQIRKFPSILLLLPAFQLR